MPEPGEGTQEDDDLRASCHSAAEDAEVAVDPEPISTMGEG